MAVLWGRQQEVGWDSKAFPWGQGPVQLLWELRWPGWGEEVGQAGAELGLRGNLRAYSQVVSGRGAQDSAEVRGTGEADVTKPLYWRREDCLEKGFQEQSLDSYVTREPEAPEVSDGSRSPWKLGVLEDGKPPYILPRHCWNFQVGRNLKDQREQLSPNNEKRVRGHGGLLKLMWHIRGSLRALGLAPTLLLFPKASGAPQCPPTGHARQLHPGLCFPHPKPPSLSCTQACSPLSSPAAPFLPRPTQGTTDPLVFFSRPAPWPGTAPSTQWLFLVGNGWRHTSGSCFSEGSAETWVPPFPGATDAGLTSRDSELNGQEGACTPGTLSARHASRVARMGAFAVHVARAGLPEELGFATVRIVERASLEPALNRTSELGRAWLLPVGAQSSFPKAIAGRDPQCLAFVSCEWGPAVLRVTPSSSTSVHLLRQPPLPHRVFLRCLGCSDVITALSSLIFLGSSNLPTSASRVSPASLHSCTAQSAAWWARVWGGHAVPLSPATWSLAEGSLPSASPGASVQALAILAVPRSLTLEKKGALLPQPRRVSLRPNHPSSLPVRPAARHSRKTCRMLTVTMRWKLQMLHLGVSGGPSRSPGESIGSFRRAPRIAETSLAPTQQNLHQALGLRSGVGRGFVPFVIRVPDMLGHGSDEWKDRAP
ncbi:hypothetical protein AAY473_002236 [Plecturocebus cupreus]